MCGIGGYLLRRSLAHAPSLIGPMLDGLRHRGPDDEGVALANRSTGSLAEFSTPGTVPSVRDRLEALQADGRYDHDLALVHTRYAIVDVGDRAHQPFRSRDGTVVGAFNGEIYNFVELRDELRALGVAFRTSSDTEVLVEGYRVWKDDLWRRLNGCWAVALYDARSRTLVLSRDRMGVCPLYYRETQEGFFFASAIRPLLALVPRTQTLDRDAVRGFVAHGIKDFDAATCYQEVRSVPPAAVLRFAQHVHRVADAERVDFWRHPQVRLTAKDLSLGEAASHLRAALFRAVELRLRADVPLAFELSGGLDSSSIVAAAATLRPGPIRTYTISVPGSDEEPFARTMRTRCALDYRVLRGDADRFDDDGPRFDDLMEEPYHSPNCFTAWQMRRAMKAEGVSVVLSGSGGDETLSGYEYEFWPAAAEELWRLGHRSAVRRHAFAMRFGSRARARLTIAEGIGGLRRRLAAGRTGEPLALPDSAATGAGTHAARYSSLAFHERALYQFTVAQLPYYLRSGDHLTMSIPLEHRLPFLDVDVVELGLQLPVEYLYRDGWSKYVLRLAMAPFLPAAIVWRRDKMGFPFPLRAFLDRHKEAFMADCLRARDAGVSDFSPRDWNLHLSTDPNGLWRSISTGRWLTPG